MNIFDKAIEKFRPLGAINVVLLANTAHVEGEWPHRWKAFATGLHGEEVPNEMTFAYGATPQAALRNLVAGKRGWVKGG